MKLPTTSGRTGNLVSRFRSFALRELDANPSLPLMAANVGWMFGDKVIRMAGSLVLTIWLARYLGPVQFGVYSYVIAFVAMFMPLASLGLDDILVKNFVRSPEIAGRTLGTAFILELIAGTVAAALSASAIRYARPDEPDIRWLVAVLSVTLILKAAEVIRYWFQSQIKSRHTILVETSLFIVFFFIKIVLISTGRPLEYFVFVLIAEALCVALGLSARYAASDGPVRQWRLNAQTARTLLLDSWPLILSNGFVFLIMNVDKVMLGGMRGDSEVGYFSAATRLTEAWYFVPVIVGSSVAPRLIQLFHDNPIAYEHAATKVFRSLLAAALAVSLGAIILAPFLIDLFYGPQYATSISVLRIHIWITLFVFQASFRTQLLIIENEVFYVFVFSALALLLNIVVNLMLIPALGAIGASWASLLAWFCCVLIFPLLFVRTRAFPLHFFSLLRLRTHSSGKA